MKTLRAGYLTAILCLVPVPSTAQQLPPKSEARTQLEAFLTQKGSILVKVFHPLGVVPASYGASADLDAVVIYEPGKEVQRRRGIKITVKEVGRLEREETSFLDLEEIDSLIKGLDYMAKASTEWAGSQRDYSEMVFMTKGDLQVGFYTDKGKTQAFIKSGTIGSATAYMQGDGLKSLRERLEAGLLHLQSN